MKSTLVFLLVASLAIIALAWAPSYDLSKDDYELFNEWLSDRPGRYGIMPSDNMLRSKRDIFMENLRIIRELQEEAGNETQFDLNDFSDLTQEEFLSMYTNPKDNHPSFKKFPMMEVFEQSEIENLPEIMDWRVFPKFSVVTPVQDQGNCGACWSFAVAGNTESVWAVKSQRDVVKMSEQQVLDCTMAKGRTPTPFGCNGGVVADAYDQLAVSKSGGLRTTEAYGEYRAKVYPCRAATTGELATVSGYQRVEPKQEAIMAALAKYGPLNVGVDATKWSSYKSGVISTACGNVSPSTNHAVLLVGYGVKNNIPVWIVKNSWNTSWGEDGYIYIKRDDTNYCRLYDRPMTVVLGNENVLENFLN